uniref:Flavin-containing monooxygenase n=1 Tax=Acrobeloides nanus TaxID=290746 RepID=A0A914DKX7_9BILA
MDLNTLEAYPFRDIEGKGRSFIPYEHIFACLLEYGKPLHDHIHFDHEVALVHRLADAWEIITNTSCGRLQKAWRFDAIFICNGHNFKEDVPDYMLKYTGNWIHSRNYRRASDYADQTVAIVGGGLSGMDILSQVVNCAKKIHFIHNQPGKHAKIIPKNVEENARCVDTFEKSLILADGSVLTGIDTVILCNGYKHIFPFFKNGEVELKLDGKIVSPLFQHVAHVHYLDSLFFIGLTSHAFNFLTIEYQVNFAMAILSGRANKFPQEVVEKWESRRITELKQRGKHPKNFHFLEGSQFDYYHELCRLGNFPYKISLAIERVFYDFIEKREINFFTYKNFQYKVLNDEDFECKYVP